jgi:hypothetical protein
MKKKIPRLDDEEESKGLKIHILEGYHDRFDRGQGKFVNTKVKNGQGKGKTNNTKVKNGFKRC